MRHCDSLSRDREWGRRGLKASYPRTAQLAIFLEGSVGVLRGTCKGPVVRSLPHTTSFPFSKDKDMSSCRSINSLSALWILLQLSSETRFINDPFSFLNLHPTRPAGCLDTV